MDPTGLAVAVGKELFDSTKPQQGVFLNYIFLHWFGGKKMSIANEVVKAEVENAYDLKRLEGKVTQQQIIQALQSADNEIDYQNLFGTMQKVLPKINPDNQKHELDKDKMKRLKDLSKEFSSDDMQEVVAGILAGEYNQPGSFSLKTMDTVKSLSKDDIELFRKFCGMVFEGCNFFNDSYGLGSEGHTITSQEGIGYDHYLHLQDIGLVGIRTIAVNMGGIGDDDETEYTYNVSIQGESFSFKKKGSSTKLTGVGYLTTAGKELLPILGMYKNDKLLRLVKNEFIKQGFTD